MDILNKKFGALVAIGHVEKTPTSRAKILCRCDCGNEKAIDPASLVHGRTKSCGCLRMTAILKAVTKHGMSATKEHSVWRSMKQRCYDKNFHGYYLYGGRGIVVCKRWLNSFENFYADMGPIPFARASLERKRVNGNYTPRNCVWATPKEQANNQRRNRFLEHAGKTQTIQQWAEELGIPHDRIRGRLRLGFTTAEALFVGELNSGPRRTGKRRRT